MDNRKRRRKLRVKQRKAKALYSGGIMIPMSAVIIAFGIAMSAFIVTGSWSKFLCSAAEISAKLTVPHGGAALLSENIDKVLAAFSPINGSSPSDAGTDSEISSQHSSGSSSSQSDSLISSSTSSASSSSGVLKKVLTLVFGSKTGSNYENYGKICVHNQTKEHKADIKNQLSIKPDVNITENSGDSKPQVLIMHTHTTESYENRDDGYYSSSDATRTADKTKSVCAVGEAVAESLKKSGISVLHDTTYHDYPSYNGAYARALKTIEADVKKYPSIKVVLDIHRDAIQYSDGTRVKPTVTINGKKAAQVMIIAPCYEKGTTPYIPDWKCNYRFALRIQNQVLSDYSTLMRPIDLCPRRYNMHVTHGSLLVEFGTCANTLDEAVYAGQLFGDELAKVLKSLEE